VSPTSPLLEHADWSFPVPVAYGPGRLDELGAACVGAGMTAPLLVTDQGSRELPFIAAALDNLRAAGLAPGIFAEAAPNPTDADVDAGRKKFREGDHDGVVAIGGGSGMDAGKSISLVARNQASLWSLDYDVEPDISFRSDDFAPLVCVPTTAGTGAETESTAMVTDLAAGTKRCVWHPHHKPHLALLDPELTVDLPRSLTAWTGVDALVHAIEAYTAPAWHPMCDGLALEAMRLIGRWLPSAVDDGADLEARGAMLVGSCLAGVSFLKGLGLVHAMSHMIGAVYDTHHGLTNAVLLPAVLRYNEAAIERHIGPMCEALGIDGHDFGAFYDTICQLLDRLSIPTGITDLGVGDDRIVELAAKAHGDAAAATNARTANPADIEAVLRESLEHAR
jgi:alcohol dehydrogenase class IV